MDDKGLEEICHWIDKYTITRPKKHLNRDFSDAVPLAEMLKVHFPRLIDMHNYVKTASFSKKMANWEILNRKVLQKMNLNLPKRTMQDLSNSIPGAIETLLKNVKKAVEKNVEQRFIEMENTKLRSNVMKIPMSDCNGNIQQIEVVKVALLDEKNREINNKKKEIKILTEEVTHLKNLIKAKDERLSFLTNKMNSQNLVLYPRRVSKKPRSLSVTPVDNSVSDVTSI